jgi:hypothetical protein
MTEEPKNKPVIVHKVVHRRRPAWDWMPFDAASLKIERQLVFSAGRADATLRRLCAGGEVRAVRIETEEPLTTPKGAVLRRLRPVPIRPSEWRTTEVDFEDPLHVRVSEGDVDHWLAQQGEALRSDPRDTAIANQLRLKPRPPWKRLCDNVRKECGVSANARGYSDETIERRAKEMLRAGGHFGRPIMTDMT